MIEEEEKKSSIATGNVNPGTFTDRVERVMARADEETRFIIQALLN